MNQSSQLKLFISYSHLDETAVKEFIKHIAPLKSNELIKEWYDRKIVAGDDFQDTIDNNLDKADIICLFISANFLASAACNKEMKRAANLRKAKNVVLIPVILSPCGWLDIKEISKLLALPNDGNPVSGFNNANEAWVTVYIGLKNVIEKENKLRSLTWNDSFSEFLESTELLSKAHSQKKSVLLSDIFVFPELDEYNDIREYSERISSESLLHNFSTCSKILIAGENQSGKTTLCKIFCTELRKNNFVPIFVTDESGQFQGQIQNRIEKAFKDQYDSEDFEEIDNNRFVIVIDEFHYAKKKEKHLKDLEKYCHVIIIVDDIFGLNFKDENLIQSFHQYRIRQFSPLLRNEIIEKWVHLTDIENKSSSNGIYKEIDTTTELVNSTLGKVLSSGIMPAYPFFILSIISTYEAYEKPLNQEITSQGYCYQALIYLYLRKQGVRNEDIDTYINFLTEFAYELYSQNKHELTTFDFEQFMEKYLSKFNFPLKKDVLLRNLKETRIINIDCCNNYSYNYPYLYYFFVAKYLAEHRDENIQKINDIINNLHKNENAYITIFISHHSKNVYLLDEIILNAMCLFDKYTPANLSKNELSFFDDQLKSIVKAVLPPKNIAPEKVRAERLKKQDVIEQINEKVEETEDLKTGSEENDAFARDLRRSIKTVEVMGIVIKNRAGSIEKDKLESVFDEAMKVHLRILSSFFDIIRNESSQKEIVEFLKTRLEEIIKDKTRIPSQDQLEKIAKTLFWNMNFSVIMGHLNKIINSLGSDKLIPIVDAVCKKQNTPASFLILHGILMWFSKNLQVDIISERIEKNDFSETAKSLMKFMVVNHRSLHQMGYKDLQKIEHKLKIPMHYVPRRGKE